MKTNSEKAKLYVAGLIFIADNDEPTWGKDEIKGIEDQMTTVMLADMFGFEPRKVALDIVNARVIRDRKTG